jgi:hypothetical protein
VSLNRAQISSTSDAILAHSEATFAQSGPIERRSGAIITDIAPEYGWGTRDYRKVVRDHRKLATDSGKLAPESREIARECGSLVPDHRKVARIRAEGHRFFESSMPQRCCFVQRAT